MIIDNNELTFTYFILCKIKKIFYWLQISCGFAFFFLIQSNSNSVDLIEYYNIANIFPQYVSHTFYDAFWWNEFLISM